MNVTGKVYIVILNWNGWKDTLECLESVFKTGYSNYRVIVCDNDSQDGSLEMIKMWADGNLPASVANVTLAQFSHPPVAKPISYIELDRLTGETGNVEGEEPQLILIRTGGNWGFAGGNNVGLRYALAKADFDYAWLLNNDTVIAPDALGYMVDRMNVSPKAGICGCTLRYYHAPDSVQTLGGASYNKWRCRASPIGALQPVGMKIEREEVELQMAYVAGASMLVSREFLEKIGLMAEDYFLYFEEFDWACRAVGHYGLVYVPESIVYHKEGGSIGTDVTGKRSALSSFYLQRNRVKFVRRFFKSYLSFLYISLLLETVRALFRRDFFEVKWTLFALLDIRPKRIQREKRLT